ncbi:MAG: sugar-binding transcriptional regulator [Eubacterium sp.]|nr:sugar-binding transcriptional regulator [Eubacterium sp.]
MNISQEQMFRILKAFYLDQISQKDIAESEGLSRASISRAVKEGFEKGYVSISLNLPGGRVTEIEDTLKQKFHLDTACVTRVDTYNETSYEKDVALALSDYLDTVLRDGDIIGLSWGRTLNTMAQNLRPRSRKKIRFVSMNGGMSRGPRDSSAEQVLHNFAVAFDAPGDYLPLPFRADNKEIVSALMQDKEIKAIFELIDRANIAIFSLGGIIQNSLLYISGYYTEAGYQELESKGYVGDICSRFYKIDGTHMDDAFYNRSIGITLEELAKKERKICIVTEPEKARALLGALRGHYIDSLFMDERTAKALLVEAERES